MYDLIAPFVVGFVGSLHCLGMCGPLVLAYSLHIHTPGNPAVALESSLWQKGILHHTAFHTGRLITYGFLGALAGGMAHLTSMDRLFVNIRGSVTLFGGILMVLAGLVLLRVVPLPFALTTPSMGPGAFFGRLIPPLFRSQRVASKMALGLATGFLPCMLSWSMIIKAATTQSLGWGFLTMASFGLGTVPALFFTGLSASILTMKVRLAGERIAALSVILMGLILILKGVRALG